MKNMLIALLAVLTLASGSAAAQSARIEIVPKPAEIVAFENQAVYKDPVLVWLDPQAGLDRNYVEQTLRETGFSPIFVDKRKKADLVFRLNKTPLNNDDEAYRPEPTRKRAFCTPCRPCVSWLSRKTAPSSCRAA